MSVHDDKAVVPVQQRSNPWAKLDPHPGVKYKGRGLIYGPEHIDAGIRAMQKIRQHQVNNDIPIPGMPVVNPTPAPEHEGHCLKCGTKRVVRTQGERITNNVKQVYGPCPNCGSQVHRLLGKVPSKKKASDG